MINAKLVVVGGAKEAEVTLRKLPATIGRSKEATITLPHGLVSRLHCEIFEEQGILYVRDLNSLNGTFLNNEKISGSRPLLPDQLLTLGNVTFRASYEIPDIDLDEIHQNAEVGSWTDDGDHCETIASEVLALQLAQVAVGDSSENLTEDVASQIMVVDEENPAPSPSISLGAINQLPQDDKVAAADANVQIVVEQAPTIEIEAGNIDIDTGNDTEEKLPDDGSLDSFIRKLPK